MASPPAACRLCPAPWGPLPSGSVLPSPGGHSFVFCEDGLAMRLNIMPVCIFISVWTKPSINHLTFGCCPPAPPSGSFLDTRTPCGLCSGFTWPALRASCAQAVHSRPPGVPLWAL